uniref:Uncharacterized protein n=1 Tax=Anguilla anguilla TaxID=7936 RepID=A0A0E9RC58_ANGAN
MLIIFSLLFYVDITYYIYDKKRNCCQILH